MSSRKQSMTDKLVAKAYALLDEGDNEGALRIAGRLEKQR